ncbi:MAG: hypothetical protein IT458_12245 [Planctomycetes bacterium]|nr:hypothetical protein [Planctomycetota bacterium]
MRATLRVLSILLVAAGAGLLVYGLNTDAESYRAPFGLDGLMRKPAELMGYAAGLLVAGVLLLLLFGVRSPGAEKAGFEKS